MCSVGEAPSTCLGTPGVMQCVCGVRLKKHIIFHILYIIVAPLCSAFPKRVDFYKADFSSF